MQEEGDITKGYARVHIFIKKKKKWLASSWRVVHSVSPNSNEWQSEVPLCVHWARPSSLINNFCLLLILAADRRKKMDNVAVDLWEATGIGEDTTANVSNATDSELIEIAASYSLMETVALSAVLLVIIVGTIVGNILVCVAVCLVRRL